MIESLWRRVALYRLAVYRLMMVTGPRSSLVE